MKRLRSYVLLLFALTGFACAHQPAVAPSEAAADSPGHTEIASLEKRIAERKTGLPGGESQSLPGGESAPTPMSSGAGMNPRCDGVCQAAEEICTCHRRICKLASEINDERSEASCRRAQRDCEEAGRSCASCH